MPIESMWQHFDEWPRLQDSPEYQKKLEQRVKQVEESEKYSLTLRKANDVLHVLNLTDKQDDILRKTLLKLDNKTLEELATKSKSEIQNYIFTIKRDEDKREKQEQKTESKIQTNINTKTTTINTESKKTNESIKETNERINQKISKIKSVFTDEILNQHTEIAEQFEKIYNWEIDKEQGLKNILNLLKANNWKILKSIVKDLWWPNSKEYQKFKTILVDVYPDSQIKNFFESLEKQSSNRLNTQEIIKDIEKESSWTIKIDLNSKNPLIKHSLVWRKYGFNTDIDKQALLETSNKYENKLQETKNGFAVLEGAYAPFGNLLNTVNKNSENQDIKENLKSWLSNFPKEIFWDLEKVYESLNIDSNIQIKESDFTALLETNSRSELELKLKNIESKYEKMKAQILKIEEWIKKEFKTEVKELLDIEEKNKEKQLEVLKFLRNSGFDSLPKDLTDRLIRDIESNVLTIPWLNLNRTNFDLRNWHFWESWAFIDKNEGLNIESKRNLVKFVNKVISWNINEPLAVEEVVNWTLIVDSSFIKNKSFEVWIMNNLWRKYSKIVENLNKANEVK